MQSRIEVPDQFLQNFPSELLEVVGVSNCIVTRSSLVLTYRGVAPASLFDNLEPKRRLEMQFIAAGSIIRNRISRFKRTEEPFHVSNIWSQGYHHWITEVLPKLVLFEERIKTGVLLLPDFSPNFVLESLQLLEFEDFEKLKGSTFFKRLSIISNPNSGHYNLNHIEPVRTRLLKLCADQEVTSKKKIYVTRRNARGRKVVNEDEVESYLTSCGFEVLDLESVSLAQQVRIFSTCELLISIHGAALTNMIFMVNGGRVVELYPSGFSPNIFFNACYHRLSSILGIKHEFLFCNRENDSTFDLHWDNVVVDIEDLKQSIFGSP